MGSISTKYLVVSVREKLIIKYIFGAISRSELQCLV